MKINPSTGFNQYKNYVQGIKNTEPNAGKAKAEGHVTAPTAANTDKVMFSEAAAAKAELGRITTAVSVEVEELGSTERLAQLTQDVAQGRYFIDSDALTSSILGQA